MGISVTKQKRLEPSRGNSDDDAKLENIADAFMKQDSYRRSANKYGVDLRDDEIAEDMPLDMMPPGILDRMPIRWQKGGLIGSGAFGKVFLGLNLDTGELLAVKQVALVGEHNKEVESFEQEIDVMRGLSHENIVQYRGICFEDDHLNIFLEYVPGGSISSLLVKFGAFSESIIRVYTRQILQGLDYLHSHHIIHRDIKGANILVDNNGVIKLADFGASKKLQGILNGMGGLRSLKGTPYYMAPEVIKQSGHGKQADIWSVGCTVYEMFTGKPPWCDIEDQVSAMFHIASSNSGPPIPDWISPEAHEFLSLCFKSDPLDRPSARALLDNEWLRAKNEPVPRSPTNKGPNSATNSPRNSPQIKGTPPHTSANDRSYSLPSSPVVNSRTNTLKVTSSPNKSIGKVYPETAVRVRSASVETVQPVATAQDTKHNKGLTVSMQSLNPVEEPSWAWSADNRKNMNFVESKLKKAENNTPNQSWRKSSTDTDPSKRELDEINTFIRKSTVVRLVSENALIQSIRDMTDLKSMKMSNEEVIETLIKRAEQTRLDALKARKPDIT